MKNMDIPHSSGNWPNQVDFRDYHRLFKKSTIIGLLILMTSVVCSNAAAQSTPETTDGTLAPSSEELINARLDATETALGNIENWINEVHAHNKLADRISYAERDISDLGIRFGNFHSQGGEVDQAEWALSRSGNNDSRIYTIEDMIVGMESDISSLSTRLDDFENLELQNLQSDLNNMTVRIDELETVIENITFTHDWDIGLLKNRATALETTIENHQSRLKLAEQDLDSIFAWFDSLGNAIDEAQARCERRQDWETFTYGYRITIC